jgi:hypothetical protein
MLREVLPYLVQVLGKDGGATFTIEKGTQVTGAAANRPGVGGAPRVPVGNARKASPLSGTGSLRLPGQAPIGSARGTETDARRGTAGTRQPAAPAGTGTRAGGSQREPAKRDTIKRDSPARESVARDGGSARPGTPRNGRPRADATPGTGRPRNGGRRP